MHRPCDACQAVTGGFAGKWLKNAERATLDTPRLTPLWVKRERKRRAETSEILTTETYKKGCSNEY